MSVDLTVSNKGLDCTQLAHYLNKIGVSGVNIVRGISIEPKGLEQSCMMRLPREYGHENRVELKLLWFSLKTRYKFDCAHLTVPGAWSGCVLNWFSDSLCPGAKNMCM